ncbi:hypothetical protein [Salinispora mooreana]|uniref:hypothetical protein n=1 Tax=Salinispora mooreana TaxID=999545 RepID=UPI000381FF67|nr:hypothetical protein [Salinispora mooreana]
MLRAVPGSGGPLTAEFEIGYVGADGAEPRATLINSAEVRFELGKPVRVFSSRKRQRHFPEPGNQAARHGPPISIPR